MNKCENCLKGKCNSHKKRIIAKYAVVEKYARRLDKKFQSQLGWQYLHKTKKLPKNFPSTPSVTYRKEWKNWNHFYGKIFGSYKGAKKLAKDNNIKNAIEWSDFLKFYKTNIKYPAHPQRIYKEWISWKDFLPPKGDRFASYEDAKRFAEKNKIRSSLEWKRWYREKKLPIDIPSKPDSVYKGKGWVNWYDFLNVKFVSFEVCKELARNSGIKNSTEWMMVHSEGLFPPDIPATPPIIYGKRKKGGFPKPWSYEK